MSGVQDPSASLRLDCKVCEVVTEDWVSIEFYGLFSEQTTELIVCEACVGVVELWLGVDFTENQDGLFQITELGKLVPVKKDNN